MIISLILNASNLYTIPLFFTSIGGPGSKKGRVCDDIVNMYNFVPVSAEDLILKELPKKVQNVLAIESTKGLADMLKVSH